MNRTTHHGYIDTVFDAWILFEACRQGHLPKVRSRIKASDEESIELIRSGAIFIYDEQESGIRRWTDGRLWSPSRVAGNFLVYQELERRMSPEEKLEAKEHNVKVPRKGPFLFKKAGLIKKTLAAEISGKRHHLVSYYTKNDVSCLDRPSNLPQFECYRPKTHDAQMSDVPIPKQLEQPKYSVSYEEMYNPDWEAGHECGLFSMINTDLGMLAAAI